MQDQTAQAFVDCILFFIGCFELGLEYKLVDLNLVQPLVHGCLEL